jgi:hypothetical protein
MDAKGIGSLFVSVNVPVNCAFAKEETNKTIIKLLAILVIKFIGLVV